MPALEAATKLQELRNLLAERFPTPARPPSRRFATGLQSFDDILEGGLPIGGITEIVRPRHSAGSATLLHGLVRSVAAQGGRIALIDGADGFDPDELENSTLRSVLWVRCRTADMATRAADWLWRDGNLPFSILDLALNPQEQLRKIPASTWHRLARSVEDRGLACLVLSPLPLVASATARLEIVHGFTLESFTENRDRLTASLHLRWTRRRAEVLPSESEKIIAFPKAA